MTLKLLISAPFWVRLRWESRIFPINPFSLVWFPLALILAGHSHLVMAASPVWVCLFLLFQLFCLPLYGLSHLLLCSLHSFSSHFPFTPSPCYLSLHFLFHFFQIMSTHLSPALSSSPPPPSSVSGDTLAGVLSQPGSATHCACCLPPPPCSEGWGGCGRGGQSGDGGCSFATPPCLTPGDIFPLTH